MSEHRVEVVWRRDTPDFRAETYSRHHRWHFEGGVEVPASAAPEYRGDADTGGPEQALVAAVAGCHMLTFLAVAARRRLVVDRYEDSARGVLEKNDEGRLAITRVVLRPRIVFAGDPPDAAELARLHEMAHRGCFIANSVRCAVDVEEP